MNKHVVFVLGSKVVWILGVLGFVIGGLLCLEGSRSVIFSGGLRILLLVGFFVVLFVKLELGFGFLIVLSSLIFPFFGMFILGLRIRALEDLLLGLGLQFLYWLRGFGRSILFLGGFIIRLFIVL